MSVWPCNLAMNTKSYFKGEKTFGVIEACNYVYLTSCDLKCKMTYTQIKRRLRPASLIIYIMR